MTVQQAIRVLRDEGLVLSRQGSGVFARERTARPVELRPVLERAFAVPDVTIVPRALHRYHGATTWWHA